MRRVLQLVVGAMMRKVVTTVLSLALAAVSAAAQENQENKQGQPASAASGKRSTVQKSADAQEPVLSASTKPSASPLASEPAFSKAIADNSFFLEEAFNQEPGVVQHISTFTRLRGDGFFYTFVQEWPAPNQRHQLSLSLPFAARSGPPSEHGIGDILLNYRFGAVQRENVGFAPRVSLVIPSGNNDRGLGSGSAGVQFNFPVSHRFSESWIYHLNAGATILPRARALTSGGPVRRSLDSYSAGGSVIWLAKANFNALLESFTEFGQEIDGAGNAVRSTEVFVSPGLRWAINVGSLQIVPGIAVPFRVNGGTAARGILFYLSFEHPFGSARKPKP